MHLRFEEFVTLSKLKPLADFTGPKKKWGPGFPEPHSSFAYLKLALDCRGDRGSHGLPVSSRVG